MIPTAYKWLSSVGTLPRMIEESLKDYGVLEVPGTADSPVIMGWARDLEIPAAIYTHDSVPWCGLYMGHVAQRANKTLISPAKAMLWALNWASWGTPVGQPCLGDVLVFVRPNGGHVGLYIGEDKNAYHVLGGNEQDRVMILRIEKHRLYAARNYYKLGPPASAKPYLLYEDGPISGNEQ